MPDLYIGLMSGTSMDGIDAALVSFGDGSVNIVATHEHSYPEALRAQLIAARSDESLRSCDDAADLHQRVGECFRDAANALLAQAGTDPSTVAAIGSHGQTLRHAPDAIPPYSLQVGDPEIIARGTGIETVADFRRADIEAGGQGAPLAPAFHEWLFRTPGQQRVVLNIGGIANITVLHGDDTATTGFDTGPGNTLMDVWANEHIGKPYDADGEWAAAGEVSQELLKRMLADPYFVLPPPKSTGFEYFNREWLEAIGVTQYEPAAVQATLSQLTADSIATSIRSAAPDLTDVLVCGGGVRNQDLMTRLARSLDTQVASTATVGLDPDWVEAVAFAWLAMRTLAELPGNLPSVTGARAATILGSVHPAS